MEQVERNEGITQEGCLVVLMGVGLDAEGH